MAPMTMRLPSRYEGYEEILPASLDDLNGPAEGVVALPLRLAWSGLTEFNLAKWKLRLGLYQIILTNGRPGDPETYINRDHLVELWPYQRRRLGPGYRDPWEDRFPELRERAAIDVRAYDPAAALPFQRRS